MQTRGGAMALDTIPKCPAPIIIVVYTQNEMKKKKKFSARFVCPVKNIKNARTFLLCLRARRDRGVRKCILSG